MIPTIQTTGWKLPQAVIANGAVTGNKWSNPKNLLLVDGDVSESNPGAGVASDVTIGNYNFNLPQGAIVVGIELQLIGYRGSQTSPVITISPNLLDDTSGNDVYYPYVTPFTGLIPTITTNILGTPTYLYASSFTVDQINNAKLNLMANGDVYIDSCLMQVFYYVPAIPVPASTTVTSCADCDSVLQVPFMTLYLPFLSGQTSFTLSPGSFRYANGQPVQPGDVGACGGQIPFVFDPDLRQTNGGNFEESAVVDTNNGGGWVVNQDGSITVTLASVNDRGLLPYTPYTHNANFMSNHNANSKVVISNNGRWTFTLLKKCQIGVLVSAPIEVFANGTLVANPVTKFNFSGAGQSTTQDMTDPEKVNIVIPGAGGTTPPVVVSTTSTTSGNTQVTTLSSNLNVSGLNRVVPIQISTEQLQSIVSVTVGGVAATREAFVTDSGHNLRSETWVCVNPPLGSQPVVVTLSGAAYLTFGAECVNGANTSFPVGATQTATGTSLSPSLAITTTTDYSLVFDSLSTALTPILYTPGAGQGLNWSQVSVGTTRQGGSSVQSAGIEPDAVTMQYAITQNTPWVYCAVEIKGITQGSTGIQSINTDTTPAQSIVGTGGTTVSTTGGVTTIHSTSPSSPGITSINTDTTAAQVITGGTGISVATVSGVTTITNTNPGTGGIAPASAGQFFPLGDDGSTPVCIKFGNYLFVNNAGTWTQYGVDATTGAPTSQTPSISLNAGASVSADSLTLYVIDVSSRTVTVTSYNTSLTLLNTASYTFSSGTVESTQSNGASTIGFCVTGTTLLAALFNKTTIPPANEYWTEFTLSGSSLSNPIVTNLEFYTSAGVPTSHSSLYATSDSSNYVYLQEASSGSPSGVAQKYTYSSPNFTAVSTPTRPIKDGGGATPGGFTIPSLTTIGWYRGTFMVNKLNSLGGGTYTVSGTNGIIYNEYSQ